MVNYYVSCIIMYRRIVMIGVGLGTWQVCPTLPLLLHQTKVTGYTPHSTNLGRLQKVPKQKISRQKNLSHISPAKNNQNTKQSGSCALDNYPIIPHTVDCLRLNAYMHACMHSPGWGLYQACSLFYTWMKHGSLGTHILIKC